MSPLHRDIRLFNEGAGVVGRNFPRGRLAFVVGGLTGVIRPRGNVDQTNSSYLINV